MIKAVFFDIDGTLVSFNTHRVPASSVAALSELKKRGIKTFIATGRLIDTIDNLGDLEFDGYITLNGCYVVAEGQVIYKATIPDQDIEAVIDYLKEHEPFPCAFMTMEGITINYVNDTVKEIAEIVKLPVPKVMNMREAARRWVLQINIYVGIEREKELMKTVFRHGQASRWHPLFADVNIKGIDKRTGMNMILKHYGIQPNETMAFGDGGNDIPLLEGAGIGVAMGNSVEEAKLAADYVTDSVDQDGIINALKHFSVI